MKYAYIIWDWNGTLLDDAELCLDIMNGILRSRNLPEMSIFRYREIFDFPVARYYEQLGFDYSKESFESLGTLFIDAYETRKNTSQLQEHAHDLLAMLHEKNVRQAVLSAYHHDALVQLLTSKKLNHFFDWIVGADDHYAHGKEEQGKQLIQDISPPSGQALLIGDTVHDYSVAHAIGVDCILVKGGHQSEQRLQLCGCPVFSNLSEVNTWLAE